jgi:multidrug efflux pump
VSLVATFGGMAACGFSLDNLSLMALTIASGFVVDDAIVMIENITRYVEAGEAPLASALKGARQIGFTVVSLTISLIAVFLPLLLMGGVVGRLFREFAITLSLAVLISAAVSLTLTPMMCARLLHAEPADHQPGVLFGWSERFYDRISAGYMVGVDWVLRHRPATLGFTVLTLVATLWMYTAIPKGFLPVQDTGLLVGVTDAAQDISFAAMSERQRMIADIVRQDPDVVAVDSFVGVGTVNSTLNSGRLYIDIGSPDRRNTSAEQVMGRLQLAVAAIPGIALHLQPVQDVTIETRATRTQYQYVLQVLDPAELSHTRRASSRRCRAGVRSPMRPATSKKRGCN